MRLANLDLNLLVALDALLQECSVTRAAEPVGAEPADALRVAGPPASTLRRRAHLPIGQQLSPDPARSEPRGADAGALAEVARIFASQGTVDPTNSTREFVLISSDYSAAVVGSRLAALIAAAAPNARLHLRGGNADRVSNDEERLRSVDGILMPHGFLHGVPHLDIYQDRWACLVAEDNDSVGEELTAADLSRLPWVVTSHGSTYSTTAIRQLVQLGVQITVQMSVDTFLAVPFMIAGTNRIALIQRRLADALGTLPGVRVLDCPLDPDPLVEALWWHPSFERDAEHLWLREQVADLARTFEPQPA